MAVKVLYITLATKEAELEKAMFRNSKKPTKYVQQLTDSANEEAAQLNALFDAGWQLINSGQFETEHRAAAFFIVYKPDGAFGDEPS